MSSLGCLCGNKIHDISNRLPDKGRLVRDQDEDAFSDALVEELQALVEADKAGRLEEWISQHFGDIYPRDLPIGHMFHDLFFLVIGHERRTFVYECKACGRLLVERKGDGTYASFVPEDGRYIGILVSDPPERAGDASEPAEL